jgi:hypothetical protein
MKTLQVLNVVWINLFKFNFWHEHLWDLFREFFETTYEKVSVAIHLPDFMLTYLLVFLLCNTNFSMYDIQCSRIWSSFWSVHAHYK